MNTTAFLKPSIIGLSIILTAFILGSSFKKRNQMENTIAVTGLGSKDFVSDEIFWSGQFFAHAQTAKEAYNLISEQKQKVTQFFKEKGFTENEIHFKGVNFNKKYRTITLEPTSSGGYSYNRTEQIFDGYTASQLVYFSARKQPELMKKIESVTQKTAELVNLGVEFEGNAIQYTYSDLPSLKHSLIEQASKDARDRAQNIVRPAKGDLNKLKNASMGVFQITGKGEQVEDTYGGNYDTYSKEKTARITVRLEYVLD
ncbi:MAG: SIMPL domain-containing protein [Chitinophagaceae bacterium]